MKQFTPQFDTDSTPLAIILSSLGVPWADPKNPCWRVYTPKDLTIVEGGKQVTLTVSEAQKRGVRGRFRFFFADHPKLKTIVSAYNRGLAMLKGASVELPNVSEEDLAMWGAVMLNNRKTIFAGMEACPPKLMIVQMDGSLEAVQGGGSVTGSVKVFGKDVSKATLDGMGVK